MNVNYPGLRYLLETYGSQGFQVVCIPCNQFGGQAPGTSEQERQAAIDKFGIDVTVVDKELVNGPHAHPLYVYMKSQQPVSFPNAAGKTVAASLSKDQGAIEWNYTKFLVDRQGIPVKRFKSAYDPLDFEGDVRLLLKGVCVFWCVVLLHPCCLLIFFKIKMHVGFPPTPGECASHPGRKVCNVDRILSSSSQQD